jgi:nucleoside-diphosphate-sugar epimerase
MGQKVLVTGATGFIGIEVSRQLAQRGMRPRLMVRRPVRGLMLRNLEAEQHLEEMAAKAGICFVFLRLPHVFGAHSLLFDQV